MMLYESITYLFPGIQMPQDYMLRDDSDGNGPYIEYWNRPEPQPTQAEIQAAYPAALAAAQRAAIPKVSRRQMLTALHRVDLLTTIRAAVDASNDVELQIAFDEALEFERGNAFIGTMAAALGKTDAEIDAIFALAAGI
jgi:hypothetical protein